MKHMAKSRKDGNKVSVGGRKKRKENTLFCSLFDVIGRSWAIHCKMQADCKQQHFRTRKQTPKLPIKANFNPADPHSGCCAPPHPPDFFFLLSLKGNSAVW